MGIIPFYICMNDSGVWIQDFALKYFQTFASHYISYLERNAAMVKYLLTYDQIKQYGNEKSISLLVKDIDLLVTHKANNDVF